MGGPDVQYMQRLTGVRVGSGMFVSTDLGRCACASCMPVVGPKKKCILALSMVCAGESVFKPFLPVALLFSESCFRLCCTTLISVLVCVVCIVRD